MGAGSTRLGGSHDCSLRFAGLISSVPEGSRGDGGSGRLTGCRAGRVEAGIVDRFSSVLGGFGEGITLLG